MGESEIHFNTYKVFCKDNEEDQYFSPNYTDLGVSVDKYSQSLKNHCP